MNEGEFPKRDKFQTIDLMGVCKRIGDRSRSLDDRYQFLEVMLSVRKKLIVTYIGQSNKSNDVLSPALVILELLQVLESQYDLKDLVIKHPLNPFSSRYFEKGSQFDSFSSVNFKIAVAVSDPDSLAHPWWQGALSHKDEAFIPFKQLVRFFKNPQRYFFKNSLGVELGALRNFPDEREPFSVRGLEAYAINQQWIEDNLNQKPISKQRLQSEGHWPDGALAEVFFSEKNIELEAFVALLRRHDLGERIDDVHVAVQVGRYQVAGQLTGCYQFGCLIYRYADLKGSDFMAALLQHLLISQKKPQVTRLITRNKIIIFPESLQGEIELEGLINIYCEGLLEPSALFIEPAFAYMNQHSAQNNGNRVKKSPMDVAHETLEKQRRYGAAEVCLLGRHLSLGENLLDSAFEDYCLNVLLPFWSQVDVQDTL
jgi:exodeoxyribonuclease V gamma subunit